MHEPLIQYKTNDQLAREEQEQAQAKLAAMRQNQPVITALSAIVSKGWEAARNAKTSNEREMLMSKRMLKGEYEPDKLAKIKAMGGSSIFMRLADEKSTAAKAWIIDILLPADDEPFGVDPTPVPDLPMTQQEEIRRNVVMQFQQDIQTGVINIAEIQSKIKMIEANVQTQLRDAAKQVDASVEKKIKDVIVESNWREALKDFIEDLVDYKAGILKGPIFRRKPGITRGPDGEPKSVDKICMEFEAVNPFNVYPSPSSKDVNDGYFIEKHSLRRKDLVAMKGVKGYDSQAIDMVLRDYGQGGLKRWLYETSQNELDRLSGRENADLDPDGTIDALQYWGSVQGLALVEHGIDPQRMPDMFAEYEVEVWQIGRYVIKCVINENPMGTRPYYKASFREKNGQFWGDGLTDLIRDICDMCNAAARNLVNNMGICSGPQIGVDKGAMPPGETLTTITPLKIWQFDMAEVQNGTRPPIWFFQPKSMVSELIKVYEFYSNEADNKSGIPKYSYGQSGGGGAVSTATGFSMMMSNASKNIKLVISNIDKVISASIRAVHQHLLLYDPDPILRAGDVKLIAKGSSSLIAKEQQQIRRNEALQIILHPMVLQTIGQDGLAKFLRTFFQGLDMGSEGIVPSEDDVLRQVMMTQNMPMLSGPQPQKGANVNPAGDRMGGADVRQF